MAPPSAAVREISDRDIVPSQIENDIVPGTPVTHSGDAGPNSLLPHSHTTLP